MTQKAKSCRRAVRRSGSSLAMTADVALNEGLVAVGEATHIVTTHPRRLPTRHRLLRANNVIGKVITVSLFFLVWKGYELVVYDTGKLHVISSLLHRLTNPTQPGT